MSEPVTIINFVTRETHELSQFYIEHTRYEYEPAPQRTVAEWRDTFRQWLERQA